MTRPLVTSAEALDRAERRLIATEARVHAAEVPAFVSTTLLDLLACMRRAIAELVRGETAVSDLERDLATIAEEIETNFAFAQSLRDEAEAANRRLADFERRLAEAPHDRRLLGPLSDQLDLLREMHHRLITGLFPLAEFRMDFDQAAATLEALLAWPLAAPETPQ